MRFSVEGLRFQLVAGEVCVAPLRVLAFCEKAWRGGNVTFFVLGASHAVQITVGNVSVTEMLTCGAVESQRERLLLESGATSPTSLEGEIPGLRFAVEIYPFALAEGDELRGNFDNRDILTLAYPPICSPTDASPVTRLGWQIEGEELRVETVHTYPEEGRGARTRSVYTLLGEGSGF